MAFFLAAAAAAAAVVGANADCVPLGKAATDAGLTSLVGAVTAVAEVDGAEALLAAVTLEEEAEEKITLFAPTNEAFEEIADVVATLAPADILSVLAYHVVPSFLDSTAVVAALEEASPAPVELPTLLGATLEASTDGEGIYITPSGSDVPSKVVITDVMTCAGVVHVIDRVLIPATPEPAPVGAYGE